MNAENGISLRARMASTLLALAPFAAAAQAPDCGATAEVALICRQGDGGRKATLVLTRMPAHGDCAQPQVASFEPSDLDRMRSIALAVGQTGECRFGDERSLRVRVHAEAPPPVGACSREAAASISLWLDGRKLAERRPVRNRCESAPAPWMYRVDGDVASDCSNGECGPLLAPEQTLASLPVDAAEYPQAASAAADAAAAAAAAPGGARRLLDRGPVCADAERELAAAWAALDPFQRGADEGAALHRLDGYAVAVDAALPDGLEFVGGAGARVYDFDFDNDGLIDRVYAGDTRGLEGWYSAPLLVSAGASADGFRARAAAPTAVPCQWDGARPPLSHCDDLRNPAWSRRVPLSQSLPAPLPGIAGGDDFFRTRTTAALPFRYAEVTYVALWSAAEPSRDYVAIYRPRPGGGREAVCLIQRTAGGP